MDEESFGIIPLKRTEQGWSVFLVQHQGANHWGFPKGKGDRGETPLESATRELWEETGLKLEKLIQENPLIEEYTFVRLGQTVHKKVFYFIAEVSGTPVLQHAEIQNGDWVSVNQAEERVTFNESKRSCMALRKLAFLRQKE